MNRYVLQGKNFIWRFEDESDMEGKLLCFVFDPEDAAVLTAMLNASVALAGAILTDDDGPVRRKFHVNGEDMRKLQGTPGPLTVMHPVVIEEPGVPLGLRIDGQGKLAAFYTWDGEASQ